MNIENFIVIPTDYIKLDTLPEDPEETLAYARVSDMSQCFVRVFPIDSNRAMDYEDEPSLVNGIHGALVDTQALIEVGSGKTECDRRYIYSIVKNKKEPSGVQYFLLLHIEYVELGVAICYSAFFDECGTTGVRDSTIFELLRREGIVSVDDISKWWIDLYDSNFQHAFLMNLSELDQFDEYFPEHALTVARRFVKFVKENM